MTTRFAIIIESSDVRGQDDLPGARLDADNWITFLESDLGGAWEKEEWRDLHKPTQDEVAALVRQHAGSYIFLAFSGHGFEEYNSYTREYETRICLNDYEKSVCIRNLAPARLGTAIFDCCRGIEGRHEYFSVANESLANRTGQQRSVYGMYKQAQHRNQIKNLFLNNIANKYTYDAVYMYACARNEAAGEDPSAGGYYTTLLIQCAKRWADTQKSNRAVCYSVYNTKQAHDAACAAMKTVNPLQHPVYAPCRQSYPFAIELNM